MSPSFFCVSVTRKRTPGAEKHSGVADLTAGFAVKRRLIEDDGAALPRLEPLHFRALGDERGDDARGLFRVVAQKFGRAGAVAHGKPQVFRGRFAGTGPGLARLGALALHRRDKTLRVDADAARAQCVLREIERKTVGVVKPEGRFAGKLRAFCKIAALLVENGETARERLAKSRLF